MLKHIVVMKFKEGVNEKQINGLRERLETLPTQISEIKEFVFGVDVLKTPRSYDYALVALFADANALALYQQHPAHLPVLELVRSLASSVIVVDFEM
jgi:hypothetical protein